jgi:hypothetical protein
VSSVLSIIIASIWQQGGSHSHPPILPSSHPAISAINEAEHSGPSAVCPWLYETKTQMDVFAEEGLRTLIIAQRALTDTNDWQFDEWLRQYQNATGDADEIAAQVRSHQTFIRYTSYLYCSGTASRTKLTR